ncbi:MAG TPA: DUF3568 family protein [Candidatus Didemnitutus sp.]|nr:DUF3568 family protein [Candidatus Didemnitutus sp.]
MNTSSSSRSLRALAAALLLGSIGGLAGCGLLDAGTHANVVAWIQGTLEVNVGVDYEKVFVATQAAIKDLQFVPIETKKDALVARLVARTALDKKVEITVTKAGDRVTKIEIHIGVVGDQDMSQLVLDRIKRGL